MSESWHCRTFSFSHHTTTLMGVVNVTPDSFSDGGQFESVTQAIDHAYRLYEDGADIIDIGGESSRPGALPVPADEEIRRVIPLIDELAGHGNRPVSIDTVKYDVAACALERGACIVNDISGLQREPRLVRLVAESEAGLVLMHMRGTPETMQSQTGYHDIIGEIYNFFEEKSALALESGVKANHICLDPGIGFSKTADQNLTILKQLNAFSPLGFPILIGVSRKSFIGKITGKPVSDREFGTAAAVAIGIWQGAHIVRVHDVRAMRDAIDVAEAIRREAVATE